MEPQTRRQTGRAAVWLGAILVVLVALPGIAYAQWSAASLGTGYAAAVLMPVGGTPTVSASGRDVTVSWPAAIFPNAQAVNEYVVARYDAVSGLVQAIGAACSGTVPALSCVEANVPSGQWQYAIQPKHHVWVGAEGPRSSTISIASPGLALAPATVTALPATLSGTLSAFATGETVTFRLDDPGTGTVLTGSITPDPVPGNGAASVSVTLPGGTTVGAHTVYAVGSLGSVAGAGVTVSDATAPTVSAAVVGKTQLGTPGFVKQAGTYYVYASVADLGDPATGVASVTADVSTLTPGQTAVALSAGSWTVGGVAYNYRSASVTATNPLTEGSKAFTVRAQDGAGNAITQGGFSVTVDNIAPSAADVQTANNGATAGKAEQGDTMTLTFSEAVEPASILAAWDGTATTVTVRLVNSTGTGLDQIQVWDSANTTKLPFGTILLYGNYVGSGATRTMTSSMVMSGSTIVITLGTPSGSTLTVTTAGTMTWTPVATPYDVAANACLTTARSETEPPADVEF